ncbi:MAG TPA: family 20 glycosylhydrolase [Opitutaceae bacterium]|nr:family 20 glycosylhydrolase [Opitutaceae bacterium]
MRRLRRAFQWDIGRQTERLDVLLELLPRYAEWGYEELYLHLEDAVAYPSFPDIARADAYSYAQLQRLVARATKVGIGVVPIINLLGHTQYLIKTPGLRDLNELRSADDHPLDAGQICPLHPRTLEVADKLLGDMAPFCTAGKVHVGLDESFNLGKCPRCRAEIAEHGLAYHFSQYVQRLHRLAQARGLRLGMWADMLNFIPEAIPSLPRDIIAYDWYYYPFRRHPKVELFNFAEVDLAKPLRAQGIEYWGCPMNGAFRYEPLPIFQDRLANIRNWWERCHRVGAAGMLVTSWEAYRLALEMPTVVDAAAASLWLDASRAGTRKRGNHESRRGNSPLSDAAMLRDGFARLYGQRGATHFARYAAASDEYPFAGYAKWEANDRWDGVDGATHKARRKEAAYFARLAQKSAPNTPKALRESLYFRAYLAERDAFLAEAAAGVAHLRSAASIGDRSGEFRTIERLLGASRAFEQRIARGRVAAEVMWKLSRGARSASKNGAILARDAERNATWREWLAAAKADSAAIWTASPVFGAWQIRAKIVNFAPALQRVSIEEQTTEGGWRELAARYTIEFQAATAAKRANIVRDFVVSVANPALPLRIVLRGLGEVKVRDIELTNGVVRLKHVRSAFKLGQPAPSRGLPEIREIQGAVALEWSAHESHENHEMTEPFLPRNTPKTRNKNPPFP